MPRKSAVGVLASAKTKKQFADRLSSYTSLTASEIEELFPKKSDREELLELLKIVNESSSENERKKKLVESITKVGGAVLKVAKRFALGQ